MFFSRKNKSNIQTAGKKNNIVNMPTYITMNTTVYKPFLTLAENNHLLIAGCTGSGKSVLVNGIITSLLKVKTPYDCQFVLVDPKMVELEKYKHVPHCVKYADNSRDIIEALKFAESEMDRRYTIMKTNGQLDFNGSDLYIIIDELMDIIATIKKQIFEILVRIALLGRAAKVHLIACSQCILSKVLPTEFKCNFPVIVGLRTATAQQSRYLIQATGCELLPNPKTTGTGKALIRDGADLFPLNIYKYPDTEIQETINHWTSKACIA